MRVPAVLLFAWLLIIPGCGNDDGSTETDGGADDAGDGMDADLHDAATSDAAQVMRSDASEPSSRIDPARIPPSFTKYDKAACGELGEACTFTEGSSCEGAICDLLSEVCMPPLPPVQTSLQFCSPGSCDDDAPYCISGRCLTLAQASCVCGAAGGSKLAACAAPAISSLGGRKEPSGEICLLRNARCNASFSCCGEMACAAGSEGGATFCQAQCVADGQKCADNPCCAGDKARCLKLSGTPDFLCYPRCSEHAQCASGCCSNQSDPMGGFCVDAARCTSSSDGGVTSHDAGASNDASTSMCRMDGASCGAGMACCTGLSCVTRSGAQGSTCMPRCNAPADCASGCCKPFSNSAGGYCDQATACTCIPQGSSCGTDSRSCCDGSRCAKFGADAPASCVKTCQSSADCGGNCCQPLEGGANVCGQGPC